MSDVKIQPTATNPMSGLAGMSGVNSCVFGSPKVQLEMIPVLEGNKPKMMLTTGAVTLMNYTDSKSGKKGEFHHVFGFAIVEIKEYTGPLKDLFPKGAQIAKFIVTRMTIDNSDYYHRLIKE